MTQQDRSEEKTQHSNGGMTNSPSSGTSNSQASGSAAETTHEEEITKGARFPSWTKSLAKFWVGILSTTFAGIMTDVFRGLSGLSTLPQSIPLVDFVRRQPVEASIIGGIFTASFIAALFFMFRPEDPHPSQKGQYRSPLFFSTSLSTFSFFLFLALLAIVITRPPWCPSLICPRPELITNPKGTHDARLEVYLITVQSTSFVIPGNPASYSTSNLPENIGAERIDRKPSSSLYRVVLGVHSLQQGRFGIVLEQVSLVIRQVPLMPRPLNVWIRGNSVTFNTNLYKVVYQGQLAGYTLPAAYLPSPFAGVQLTPGEADQLSLQVSSRVLADIQFQVQITYRVTNESERHTLLLPYSFEVVFSKAPNWHEYQLQNGHFVASP